MIMMTRSFVVSQSMGDVVTQGSIKEGHADDDELVDGHRFRGRPSRDRLVANASGDSCALCEEHSVGGSLICRDLGCTMIT